MTEYQLQMTTAFLFCLSGERGYKCRLQEKHFCDIKQRMCCMIEHACMSFTGTVEKQNYQIVAAAMQNDTIHNSVI